MRRTGPSRVSRWVAAVLCVAATGAAAAEPKPAARPVTAVLHDGRTVEFEPVRAKRSPEFVFSGWSFGAKITGDRARDKHGNLYIALPGNDHVSEAEPQYSHNRIISYMPQRERIQKWDVYWVLTLDPTLRGDFRSERELIVAAQETFDPAGLAFDDLPTAVVLREQLRVTSLDSFGAIRTAEGRLPRVIIVPAGFAIRGTVRESAPPFARSDSTAIVAPASRPAIRD